MVECMRAVGCVNIPATLTLRTEETARMAENQIITIPLTRGYFATIDASDHHLVDFYKWCASEKRCRATGKVLRVYAMTWTGTEFALMHVLIFGRSGKDIDHKDGDGLNNRRSNLRLASRSQNNANAHKRSGTSSRYKGVHFHSQSKKWSAQIRKRHLGQFREEFDAAQAYNFAAQEDYGEFARFNMPC